MNFPVDSWITGESLYFLIYFSTKSLLRENYNGTLWYHFYTFQALQRLVSKFWPWGEALREKMSSQTEIEQKFQAQEIWGCWNTTDLFQNVVITCHMNVFPCLATTSLEYL